MSARPKCAAAAPASEPVPEPYYEPEAIAEVATRDWWAQLVNPQRLPSPVLRGPGTRTRQ